ncbi:unnamed protein product [Pedinophyceae sp. YPF-701]|nr:unnamed protein product [Pedinophyceae sp. YPF-701]
MGLLSKKAKADADGDVFHDVQEAWLHDAASDEGGYACKDKETLERQRSAIFEFVKEVGKKIILGGGNLMNMSMPVKMFEPRSYLQKLTDVWVHPRLLDRAAETRDPVERMRLVVAWFLSGMQYAFDQWAKPFNPLLGETFQGELDDGSKIFIEQVSHHPPISVFEYVGKNGRYKFSGSSQPDVKYKTSQNALQTFAHGARVVTFHDGTKIDIKYPTYYLKGLVYVPEPRAELIGDATFTDARNGLECKVQFGPIKTAPDPLLRRTDTVHGAIVSTAPTSDPEDVVAGRHRFIKAFHGGKGINLHGMKVMSVLTGNWLSHVDWDDTRYWTLQEEEGDEFVKDPIRRYHWKSVKSPLPSDSQFREDLARLRDGDKKDSQKWKEIMENRQRADKKHRVKYWESKGLKYKH